jgi:hypothetical protein
LYSPVLCCSVQVGALRRAALPKESYQLSNTNVPKPHTRWGGGGQRRAENCRAKWAKTILSTHTGHRIQTDETQNAKFNHALRTRIMLYFEGLKTLDYKHTTKKLLNTTFYSSIRRQCRTTGPHVTIHDFTCRRSVAVQKKRTAMSESSRTNVISCRPCPNPD